MNCPLSERIQKSLQNLSLSMGVKSTKGKDLITIWKEIIIKCRVESLQTFVDRFGRESTNDAVLADMYSVVHNELIKRKNSLSKQQLRK